VSAKGDIDMREARERRPPEELGISGRIDHKVTLSDGVSLSVRLVTPNGQQTGRGVLLVHGFAAEKTENGLFDTLASRLAAGGLATAQYDWRGLGDSEGTFHNVTLQRHADDLVELARWFEKRIEVPSGSLSVIGFSLGATILAMAAKSGFQMASAVFLSPAFRPKRDMWPRYKHLQRQLRETEAVTKPGSRVLLGQAILGSLEVADVTEDVRALRAPLLVCHGSKDQRIPLASTRRALSHVQDSVQLEVFKGASHSFRPEKEHRPRLGNVVCEWLLGLERNRVF